MDIHEKEYYLKYFYLIDSDKLVEKIANRFNHEYYCDNTDEYWTIFFESFFSEVLNASSDYTSFVNSPDTFNCSGGSGNIKASNGFSLLTIVTLRNHCILHGFHSLLKSQKYADLIKISGKNHIQNRRGHFETDLKTNTDNESQDESTISQAYNGSKKRFNKSDSYYSHKIMCSHFTSLDNGFPVAPSYAANWFCFLFNEPLVYTMDKNIANYTKASSRYPLIKHYSDLYEKCLDWIKMNRLCPEDTLLFTQAMEFSYGFSFFQSAAKLLNKVHSAPSDFSSMTLKDLEGESLLFNIQQAAQLPITYNRHIFIDYGIYSVLSSRHLKDVYTPVKERSLFSAIPAKASSKNQLTLSGLYLIENYLQRLKYIAIPLIQDLWEVAIYKLNNKNSNLPELQIDLDTYRSYIQKNYSLLTNDYTGMSEDQLSNISEDTLSSSENILGVVDSYHPCDYYKILSSKYERESLEHLLDGYLVFERFNEAQRSSSSSLIESLQTEIHLIQYNPRKLQFYKNHKENIASFCQQLPPLCTPQKSTDSTEPPIPQSSESL